MKILIILVLAILRDNRGELTLPDRPRKYSVGGINYTVSVVYETPACESVNTLGDRFEHLVKCSAIDLRSQAEDDTLTAEYVPAADKKGA